MTGGRRASRRVWPSFASFFNRDFLRYLGPGFIVTVGFIDPGNWATNVAGGSQFDYSLLWVITLGTLMLILFQSMSARLGIVTGHSLAYNIRNRFSAAAGRRCSGAASCWPASPPTWPNCWAGPSAFRSSSACLCWSGGVITAVLQILLIVTGRYRHIERIVVAFIGIIAVCYVIELALVHPDWGAAAHHAFVPNLNKASMLVAIGMLGAVVMPHNVYLHSNVVLSREQPQRRRGAPPADQLRVRRHLAGHGPRLDDQLRHGDRGGGRLLPARHRRRQPRPRRRPPWSRWPARWPGCCSASACCSRAWAPASPRPWRR